MILSYQDMKLLSEVEKPGSSIDDYVNKLKEVLDSKIQLLNNFRQRVTNFEMQLQKEETMSKSMKRS